MVSSVYLVLSWLDGDAPDSLQDAACAALWLRAFYASGLRIDLEEFEMAMIRVGVRPVKIRPGLWTLELGKFRRKPRRIHFPQETRH